MTRIEKAIQKLTDLTRDEKIFWKTGKSDDPGISGLFTCEYASISGKFWRLAIYSHDGDSYLCITDKNCVKVWTFPVGELSYALHQVVMLVTTGFSRKEFLNSILEE